MPTNKTEGFLVLLSIIVPCFNDGNFLLSAIDSIEKYAPIDREVIIINDGSTETQTLEVLTTLKKVGYQVINQAHIGVSHARNAGISQAQGKYILALDADNLITAEFLVKAIDFLELNPKVGIVYGSFQTFGLKSIYYPAKSFNLYSLLRKNYLDTYAVFRKQVWVDCQGYDSNLMGLEDWEFWINAAKNHWQFHALPDLAFYYRIKEPSKSLLHRCMQENIRIGLESYILKKHIDLYQKYYFPRLWIKTHIAYLKIIAYVFSQFPQLSFLRKTKYFVN